MRGVAGTLLISWAALAVSACGGAEVSDKAKRRSDQLYDAAYIAWFEERDNLTAIRNLTRSVTEDPQNDLAHYLLGSIRLSRGEYDEAERHLREAVKLRSEGRPTSLAEAQNSLGVLLIHTKKLDEAIEILDASAGEVLNREPWLALGNLGWAYTEIGRYDKAIEVLRRAVFEQPKFCVGLYRLANAYYLNKEHQAAVSLLKKVIGTSEGGCDKMQEAHHLMGMAYLRLDMPTEAAEAFKRCREINEVSEIGIACSGAKEAL